LLHFLFFIGSALFVISKYDTLQYDSLFFMLEMSPEVKFSFHIWVVIITCNAEGGLPVGMEPGLDLQQAAR
jgi:hypothetical protein